MFDSAKDLVFRIEKLDLEPAGSLVRGFIRDGEREAAMFVRGG
jgi:hypothetical protein